MTGDYDFLATLANKVRDGDRPEWREFALWLLREAKKEIEKTVPADVVAKVKVQDFYIEDLERLAVFLEHAHSYIDHTDKYHLKTFSLDFQILLGEVRTAVMFIDRNSIDTLFLKKKTADKYPQLLEFIKQNNFVEGKRGVVRGTALWEHHPVKKVS